MPRVALGAEKVFSALGKHPETQNVRLKARRKLAETARRMKDG
jgi:hypothetical protein